MFTTVKTELLCNLPASFQDIGRFNTGERAPSTYLVGVGVGPWADMDAV
jgi:hypothetical protein